MINKVILKGAIIYKKIIDKEKPILLFGLSYNSIDKQKIHSVECLISGPSATIFKDILNTKDHIMVVGSLISVIRDSKIVQQIRVETFEPLKTKNNVVFRDTNVDEKLFDKYIEGFDFKR